MNPAPTCGPGLTPLNPAEPSLVVSLLDIVILLARRRQVLYLSVFAAILLGGIVSYLLPPYFTAVTTIMPPQQSNSSASSMLAQLGGAGALAGLGGSGLKSPTELYVSLLQSETVERGLIDRFDLMREYKATRISTARKILEGKTEIDGKQKDGLIRIYVSDKSAERAAALANGYVEQCRKLSDTLAVSEASQRRLFLDQQLEQAKDKLAAAEEDFRSTQEKTGVIQVDAQARALIESAANLRAQVAAKEVLVQSMRTYAASGNVDLMQAEQELSGLHAQLSKLNGQAGAAGSGLMQEKGQITGSGLQYARKLREVKYQETLFEILARQFESAKLDEAREGALIQVVDVARVPDYRTGPKRAIILGGFVLFALIASTAYILLQAVFQGARKLPLLQDRFARLKHTFSRVR